MLLYRISKTKYAKDLTGEGARKSGGRWNLKGIPAIYTSDSTALAALEVFIHTPLNIVPKNMSITTFELPDVLPVDTITLSGLPSNWHTHPAPVQLAKIGIRWLESCKAIALRVPSSVIPKSEGWNYLLNPRHPDFSKIRIVNVSSFDFDKRFYRR